MELRQAIEPNFDIAAKRYPEVLKIILDYIKYCDDYGDEDNSAYKAAEDKLHVITGKDMSQFNLSEPWEEEGEELLAFRISLPDPVKLVDITREELIEVIRRHATPTFQDVDDESFKGIFSPYIHDYYLKFLALNFKKYHYKYFSRQKDKNGNYFEHTQQEVIDALWNNGNY